MLFRDGASQGCCLVHRGDGPYRVVRQGREDQYQFFKPKVHKNRRIGSGRAVEMGVMLCLGVTLAAGIAVWGFARNQAGVQEQQLGNAFNGNVNALNEQFVVAQVVYAASSITIYIYNSGQAPVQFAQIEVYNSTRTKIDLTFTATKVTDLNHAGTCSVTPPEALESTLLSWNPTNFAVNGGAVSSITLTFPGCYTGTFKSGF